MQNKQESAKRPLKGLFVLLEGIEETIFDSQVALHAAEMSTRGVQFEIWSFEGFWSKYPRSLKRLSEARRISQSNVRLFHGVCIHFPLSDLMNSLLLLYQWWRLKPNVDFIHARADWTASSCGLVARWLRVPVLYDCRGDSAAEFAHSFQPRSGLASLAKWAYLHVVRWRTRYAASTCTGANFVSRLLRERLGEGTEGKPVAVIPCPVSSAFFFFSPELRRTTRERLEYGETDRVVIYSGGLAKYQGFLNYVVLFLAFHRQDARWKFLIVSPAINEQDSVLAALPVGSYQVHFAPIQEMNAYYNAADFGMLLREDNAVNQVASPTKFGEYCMTGLPVIMNDAVRQAVEFARRFGNYCSARASTADLRPYTEEERRAIMQRASSVLSREALSHEYKRLYIDICGHQKCLSRESA